MAQRTQNQRDDFKGITISFNLKKTTNNLAIPTVAISEEGIEPQQKWTTFLKGETNRFIAKHGSDRLFLMEFAITVKPEFVKKVLLHDIKINGQKYSFLGCSSGGLKSRKCYLLRGSSEDVKRVLAENGNFEAIKTVSKRLARIGLLFSSVTLTGVKPDNIVEENDITTISRSNEELCFSDGCGGISVDLARKIYKSVKDSSIKIKDYLPAVYQVRYQGYKGVFALHPQLEISSVLVRPSMQKFKTDSHPCIGVCEYSRPYTFGHLNRQFTLLLSGLGVPDSVFEEKQKQLFDMVKAIFIDAESAITILQWQNKFEVAQKLVENKESLKSNKVKDSLTSVQNKLINEAEKLRILIPHSRNIFGVCDPSGVLQYGQCFVRLTIDGKPKTIHGKVVVSKNPCYLQGDVRVLQAVNFADNPDAKQLDHLVDCIVFPTQGKSPHPNEIAGSDLDGDKYFVTWDEDLIPPRTVEPYGYPGAPSKPQGEISIEKMIDYFAKQNQTQRLVGRVDSLFRKWANLRGIRSSQCERLGQLFARVVDAAKTGERIVIPKALTQVPTECDIKYVWQKMQQSAEELKLDSHKLALQGKLQISPDTVGTEFLTDLLKEQFSNLSEFDKLEFAWNHAFKVAETDEETLKIVLDNYVDHINFGLCSAAERKHCMDKGIPSRIVLNALNKSKLLSSENLEYFGMDLPDNEWKFFFRQSHNSFNWPYLIEALTSHKKALVVLQLPDQVRLVMQFEENCNKDENQVLNSGSVSAFLFSGHFQYKMNYVIGKNYCLDLTDLTLQLYRQQKQNTFICFKAEDFEAEDSNSISVDLTRFKRNILQRNTHPLVRKTPLISIEVFVMDRSQISYLDTVAGNEMEQVPEEETALEEDAGEENLIEKTSKLFEDSDTQVPEHVVEEEVFQQLMKRATEQASPALFHKILQNCDPDFKPADLSTHLLLFLQAFIQKTVPISVPDEGRDTLSSLLIYGDMLCNDPSIFMSLLSSLCQLGMKDAAWNLLSGAGGSVSITLDVFLDLMMQWQSLWLLDVELAKTFINLMHAQLYNTAPDDEKLQYIAHFALLNSYALLEEMASAKEQLKEQSNLFIRNLICEPVADISSKEEDHSEEDQKKQVSFYKSGAAHFPFKVSRRQFLPLSRQAYPEVTCCIVQVKSVTFVPPSITVELLDPMPDILANCQVSQNTRYWQLNEVGNIISYARIVDALKELSTDAAATELAPILFNPGGHPEASPLQKDGHDLTIPACESGVMQLEDLNLKQQEAVTGALQNAIGLIHGPPGTGKTMVACEIVRHVHRHKNYEGILVCAETNIAVDSLVRRLQANPELHLVRIGSDNIAKDLFDVTLEGQVKNLAEKEAKRPSFQDKSGIEHLHKKLVKQVLKAADIVLTTCAGAGDKVLTNQTFEFVLVDEATMTMETTLLCALVHGARHLVLIGDPNQLGPLAVKKTPSDDQSTLPDVNLLSTTLFHRLHQIMPIQTFFLDTQHRMHPALMEFPSNYFYDGKLRAGVTEDDRKPVCFPWPGPNPKPLCFVNVEGRERRARTSYCNVEEQQTVKLVLDLLFNLDEERQREERLMQKQVVVVSFYQGQVSQTREYLKRNGYPQVEVNSIDGFQGRESDVIIASAVRANDRQALGFTDDRNRFNVLLTRARRGLIIIGNRDTLEGSEMWRDWLGQAPQINREQLQEKAEGPPPAAQDSNSNSRGRGGHQRGRGAGGRRADGQRGRGQNFQRR